MLHYSIYCLIVMLFYFNYKIRINIKLNLSLNQIKFLVIFHKMIQNQYNFTFNIFSNLMEILNFYFYLRNILVYN